jgi:hypothetical protein
MALLNNVTKVRPWCNQLYRGLGLAIAIFCLLPWISAALPRPEQDDAETMPNFSLLGEDSNPIALWSLRGPLVSIEIHFNPEELPRVVVLPLALFHAKITWWSKYLFNLSLRKVFWSMHYISCTQDR